MKHGFHPLKSIYAELPGDHWTIYLTGPFPTSNNMNHYILVMVDIATQFILLWPIPDKQAAMIAAYLFQAFCEFGFPKVLQSDNGTEFVNKIIKMVVETASIDHRLITPYHPRANGVAEKHVHTVVQALQKWLKGTKKDWDLYIPETQFAINTKVAAIHGSTLFSLMFRRQYNSFQDYKDIEPKSLSHPQLQKYMDYLTAVVFPSISEQIQGKQQKIMDKFNWKTHA